MSIPISSLMFFFTLVTGTLLSVSSSSWFGAWIGLELNLISFIPLITIKMNPYFSEAALKYFLIQALASTLIVMSSCMYMSLPSLVSPMILMALLLKLGAAPFHFWFPQVMEGLSWPQTIILMSIQKLAPMFLISYLMSTPTLIMITTLSAVLSAIVGGLGGLNVMKLRKIMAFSSINHMSWMLIAITLNDMMWIIYFLFYAAISSSIVIFFHTIQVFTISDMLNPNYNNPLFALTIPLSLLSLGGLPPFTGFIPKWLMIQIMVSNNMILPLFFLLVSALITLFFYLRISIPFMMLLTPILSLNMKNLPYYSSYPIFPLIMFFNSLGLFIPLPYILL
uniref:NADH-ubiquinone oxidoreductase chain 2 n=1 Tax=Epixanthus frontalis TaxID=864873 RepID=A0A343S8Q9_9EUCA|nr:NADH dehydrogenase subunit 2 [Epixanthus frontalis]AUN45034.1 NADH dehydrogenase subunit 2 [Epixanthus frontalis]